ncbi:MAG: RadC family protein, partial [Methyloligellaceae bacterium]
MDKRQEQSFTEHPVGEIHHTGHRQRLRKRFDEFGGESLADYELLEMVLFRAISRRDTKPLAKALLKKFKNLPAVIHAPEHL